MTTMVRLEKKAVSEGEAQRNAIEADDLGITAEEEMVVADTREDIHSSPITAI